MDREHYRLGGALFTAESAESAEVLGKAVPV
jgi:hypothetical protein